MNPLNWPNPTFDLDICTAWKNFKDLRDYFRFAGVIIYNPHGVEKNYIPRSIDKNFKLGAKGLNYPITINGTSSNIHWIRLLKKLITLTDIIKNSNL